MARIPIGKIPISKGEYVEGMTCQKLWQVTDRGSTFQSRVDNNTTRPTALDADGRVIKVHTDLWLCVADATEAVNATEDMAKVKREWADEKADIDAKQAALAEQSAKAVSDNEDATAKAKKATDDINAAIQAGATSGSAVGVAEAVTYDNSKSGLEGQNLQKAVDEAYRKSNVSDEDGNVANVSTIFHVVSNNKYVWALLDQNENLLIGIKRSNGKIDYGNGLPEEAEDKINEAVEIANNLHEDSAVSINKLSDEIFKTFGIKDTNGEFLTMSTLLSVVDNKKYSEVKLDGNENIIEVRHKETGIKESFLPVKIQGTEFSVVSSKKYIFALLDGNENIVLALTRDNADLIYGADSLREAIARLNIVDESGNPLILSELFTAIASKVYSRLLVDKNGNLLVALNSIKGIFQYFLPLSIQGTELSVATNSKYIVALLDDSDNFIIGLNRKNGKIEYGNGIPDEVQDAIESHTPNLEGYATEEYVDDKVEKNGLTDIEKQSIEDYNLPVPSYYKDYLAERIAKINDIILNNEGYNDSFIFITDCHTPSNHLQSPKLIKYILANTTLNKVFYGGDTPAAYGTKDDIYNTALVFLKAFYKAVQPYGHLYCAVGNHDFTIRTSATDPTGYTFPRQFGRNVYMGKHRIGDGIVTNEEDSGAAYYYVDNADEKVRYVVINTTDISNAGNNAWATSMALSKVQMNWIGNTAIKKCPNDYKIVIIGHIPPMRANISNGIQIGHWSSFITAMKNKTSVTIGDTVYDFSDIADIVFTIWGHEHQDEQTFANGIPWVVSACDAWYVDYRHAMFGNETDYSNKAKGTIYEQTFDIVNLDFNNNVANLIRIGGGYDRKIHLNVQEVKVGNTITLATDIESPTWEAADAIGNTQDKTTWKWTKKSNITSVSDGAVSALATGYSVICAYNPTSKEMELWGIKVTE